MPADSSLRFLISWLILVRYPSSELIGRIDVNTEQHFGVFYSAKLRALAEIGPRLQWIDPHFVDMVGDEVCLSTELRNPEAMIDICRHELEIGRRWMIRIANRHVQLVSGHNAKLWISEFPPELVPDARNVQCRWRF